MIAKLLIAILVVLPSLSFSLSANHEKSYTFLITASKTLLTKTDEKNVFLITISSPNILYQQDEVKKNTSLTGRYTTVEKFLSSWKQQQAPYHFFNGILSCSIGHENINETIGSQLSDPTYDKNNNTLTFIVKPFKNNKKMEKQTIIPCTSVWIIGFDGEL